MSREKKNVGLFIKTGIRKEFNDKGVGISCSMFFDNVNLNFGSKADLISGLMNKHDFVNDSELVLRSLILALDYYKAANSVLKDVVLHVYTDSTYLESRLSIIDRLSKNHFYSSDDKPIQYADEWREISSLVDEFSQVTVSLCYPSNSEKMLFVSDKVDMLLD